MSEFDRRTTPPIDALAVPWAGRVSLVEHLQAHLLPDDAGLSAAGQALPDEQQVTPETLRWAPGALDGVMSHHVAGKDDLAEQVQILTSALYDCARSDTDDVAIAKLAGLYALLRETRALQVVDALSERIVEERAIPPHAVHGIARYLVEVAADREPLKLGLALLGLVAQPEDEELLVVAGSHDEFTLFAAVALMQSQPDPLPALWRLARRVHGWGRIHVIERLARIDELPDALRDWLLCEGYRNDVMIEYTALLCAQVGRLQVALDRESVSDAILDGAGQILSALLTTGGPAATMDDYGDGAAVLSAFLHHVERRPARLFDFGVIRGLLDWLDDEENWPERQARGFSAEWRRELRERCSAFLSRPSWPTLVTQGLSSSDRQMFFQAEQAAHSLGIDCFDAHFAWLTSNHESRRSHYYSLMQDADPARIDRVLAFAERDLDLSTIATGPSRALAMGPAFAQHNALDFILQALDRWPGRGVLLVRAGLRSPSIRNRNLALSVLLAWPKTSWPDDAMPLLTQALADEPDAALRGRLETFLHGSATAP